MANTARVTQAATEVLASQTGDVRITQAVVEYLVTVGIGCGSPPAGQVGTAYSNAVTFGGGVAPYTFTITSGALPPGLAIGVSTGVIAGVPTLAGTFNFTVTVTDSIGGANSIACSIVITNVTNPSVAITLYGWKLYPEDPCQEPETVRGAPHVKRAV